MKKNLFRLGIILILVLTTIALILSGRSGFSRASTTTLSNGDYVRDNWVYDYPVADGGGATGGDATSDKRRFQKISDLSNFDLNIAQNAVVRIDTTPGFTNTFNSVTVGEGATLTHTPMGYKPSGTTESHMKGYVMEPDYFAVRWTGWIYIPANVEPGTISMTVDDGAEFYLDPSPGSGSGSEDGLERIKFTSDGTNTGADSWRDGGATKFFWCGNCRSPISSGALYRIAINFFEYTGSASMQLKWQLNDGAGGLMEVVVNQVFLHSEWTDNPSKGDGVAAHNGDGLNADYYVYDSADAWNGADRPIFKVKNYRYTRIDPTINFDFADRSPFVNNIGKINTSSIEDIKDDSHPLDTTQNTYGGGFSRMVINAKSITLRDNGKISVNGAGFPGGGIGSNTAGQAPGHGPGRGVYNLGLNDSGGGSYCTRGAFNRGEYIVSGPIYGNSESYSPYRASPTPLGSGGAASDTWGGNGGGLISLNVENLSMEHGSQITSIGTNGQNSNSGNGSGGTVYVYASKTFTQAPTASFSVNGAYSVGDDKNASAPGRVAIHYPPGGHIPFNISATSMGENGVEDCPVILAEIGAAAVGSTLSITKILNPATVKPGQTVTISLSIYNPTGSIQTVNVKDKKFDGWTYPPTGQEAQLNMVEHNLKVGDTEITADTIDFNDVIVQATTEPGIITYELTVPDSP